MKKNFAYFIIPLIFIIINIFLIYYVNSVNLIPFKFLLLLSLVLLLLNILAIVFLIINKKKIFIVSIIIYIFIILIDIFGIVFGNVTLNFLKNAFSNLNKEITTYDIVVLNNDSYTELNDLNDKNIAYLSDNKNIENCMNILDKEIIISYYANEDLYDLYNKLISGEYTAILIDDAYIDVLLDDYSNLENDTKILYSFDIVNKIEQNDNEVKKLKPINIFISGSDARSTKIYNKSRSDVNMILTINPNTRTVLMTSIPRDYYVQVHGQTGLKDKLTHAGIYGVDVSAATVEDLFNIDISYTVKIGFSAVVKVVDIIGGIDIDSDQAFKSHASDGGAESTYVVKGMNHFTGAQALSYARERYAYASGDRHRVQNQQQVLEAVLNKVSSNKAILLKYDDLLDSLSDLYLTDIPKEYIQLLVKQQLSDMSDWTFISQSVSGSDAMLSTHTAPNLIRYVMIPYDEDVTNATAQINKVLKGKE